MSQKIPPPPQLTGPQWQAFNRWLLEVTSIISNEGGIDPTEVTGLPALFTQVDTNTSDIAVLETGQSGQSSLISTLLVQLLALQSSIATINGQITTLSNRAQAFNGVGAPAAGLGLVNDWYANVGGAVGARIYIKTTPTVWTPFPF